MARRCPLLPPTSPTREITDKRCGDNHGTGADHSHGDRDRKIVLTEPAVLVVHALLQEWNDDEAASEGEGTGLEEGGTSVTAQDGG